MGAERIAELLEPFLSGEGHDRLSAEDFDHISMYIDMLLRWNARINLTAIRDPEEIVTRHFGESFFLAGHLFPDAQRNVRHNARREEHDRNVLSPSSSHPPKCHLADLGSGAGFPGIPIKIWEPNVSVALIESNHKKATFLREIVRTLGLGDVNVENVRGETLPKEAFDVVTFRAVERFKEALAIATRLVRPRGRIAMLVSSSQSSEVCANYTSFAWGAAEPVPLSNQRVVLIGRRGSQS
jgi:16S rRNA (guanine527-N7)-methyltransferase